MKVIKAPRWTEAGVFETMKRSGRYAEVQQEPHPAAVAECAIQKLSDRPAPDFSYERTVPLYLQPSYAERKRQG